MTDTYNNFAVLPSGPVRNIVAATPNDSADLSNFGFLYVGADGDVRVTTVGGQTVTIPGLVGGQVYPIYVRRVFSTGTTATDLQIWY